MKKIIALIVALTMTILSTVSAFAVEKTKKTSAQLVATAVQEYSIEKNIPVKVVSSRVSKVDDFTLCTMLLETPKLASSDKTTVHAVHAWFDTYDQHLGDIEIAADFIYDGKSAQVFDGTFWSSSLVSDSGYIVTNKVSRPSSTFNKAYYKITYNFIYKNKSKKATLEVNCSKNGDVGENGGVKNI